MVSNDERATDAVTRAGCLRGKSFEGYSAVGERSSTVALGHCVEHEDIKTRRTP